MYTYSAYIYIWRARTVQNIQNNKFKMVFYSEEELNTDLLASAGAPASMQTSTKGPKPMADFLLLARLASSSHCRVLPNALQQSTGSRQKHFGIVPRDKSHIKRMHKMQRSLFCESAMPSILFNTYISYLYNEYKKLGS